MAWRPTEFLIEGELDNTKPDRVTGWMRFAGMKEKVTFDLTGNFHRDIRGAKIHFTGDGSATDDDAVERMAGFSQHQTGKAGDITAGLPPHDYGKLPYVEWYSDDNGRVVVEPDPDCIQLIGRPIPVCECDPISRRQQDRNMANFLADVGQNTGIPAIAPEQRLVSDPQFTHWIVVEGHVIGEARDVKPEQDGTSFAYVRLFNMPECAEYGWTEDKHLRCKTEPSTT